VSAIQILTIKIKSSERSHLIGQPAFILAAAVLMNVTSSASCLEALQNFLPQSQQQRLHFFRAPVSLTLVRSGAITAIAQASSAFRYGKSQQRLSLIEDAIKHRLG
jgi:hypothetical protein